MWGGSSSYLELRFQYMFPSHQVVQPLCLQSVIQLTNGFFSPIIHCKAPAQFFFLKKIIGCSVLSGLIFLIALPIKKAFPTVYYEIHKCAEWKGDGINTQCPPPWATLGISFSLLYPLCMWTMHVCVLYLCVMYLYMVCVGVLTCAYACVHAWGICRCSDPLLSTLLLWDRVSLSLELG